MSHGPIRPGWILDSSQRLALQPLLPDAKRPNSTRNVSRITGNYIKAPTPSLYIGSLPQVNLPTLEGIDPLLASQPFQCASSAILSSDVWDPVKGGDGTKEHESREPVSVDQRSKFIVYRGY